MNKITNIDEAKELVKELNRYCDAYYNRSESLVSDEEYDKKFDMLVEFEKETGIVFSNSPAHSVGYEVISKLDKAKHSHPMLSLNKTKSVDDLISFIGNRNCVFSLKMDGLTILLTYDNGKLIKAETRGNGIEGEDITHNAITFENIPLTISYKGKLEVEGEAIITYDDFNKINEELPKEKQYKNPRNLASGSVRQLDSKITAQRHLQFIAWKVPYIENEIEWYDEETDENVTTKTLSSYANKLKCIRELGFDIVPYTTHTTFSDRTKQALEKTIEMLRDVAKEFSYPIDGLVMTYNDTSYAESLGSTDHHPKHSIAFKFYDDVEETILKNVEWQVGKSGHITPVAIFKPVNIDGTIVERASLHNLSIFNDFKLSIGDRITVYKSNQIIPKIKENLSIKDKQNKNVTYIDYPEFCPICGKHTLVDKDNNSDVLVCSNPRCKGKILGRLSHFVSKEAMNIDGLSESTLEKLLDLDCICAGLWSIYDLHDYKDYLYETEGYGFGKKSVDKLLANIEKSRTTTLDRFINGLSIPSIGKVASKNISKHFNGSFVEFDKAISNGSYDWTIIDDFGEVAANNIKYYFLDEGNVAEYRELVSMLIFETPEPQSRSNILEGKTIVITGSLACFKNRQALVDVIEQNGGKIASSVSKKTDYLINNDINSSSSKNKKAKSLGVSIITEEDFLKIIS